MNKKVEIKKKIEFPSMIGEICAISLENHLKFVDSENIDGYFSILGRYKTTSASRIEEDFQYEIPVEISLTNEVDPDSGMIDITDFYYDITDGNSLLCNIEIMVQADEVLLEERECDGDPVLEKEIEIPHIEEVPVLEKEEIEKREEEPVEEVDSTEDSFFSFHANAETYGTFIVYIVRQNETINSIIEKYHTSLEEIEKYNDLKDLSIGTKIIIPIPNEQDSK